MNLGQMMVLVSDELTAPDVEPATLRAKINLAILRAERKHNFKAMERLVEIAFLADITTYARGSVAPNYKMARKLWVEYDTDSKWFIVRVESKERFNESPRTATNYDSSTSGFPELYIVDSLNLIVNPAPTANATGQFLYYQYLPELANNNDSNYFTETLYDMVTFGAAKEIARMLEHDKKMAEMEAEFNRSFGEAVLLDGSERVSNQQFVQERLPDLGFGLTRN